MEEYMTPTQVAKKLQVGVITVYRYLRSGKLKGTHVSRKCWRVTPSDLYTFMQRGR